MKKLMAVFALLFAAAAVFLTAAFSASAAEEDENLKAVGLYGLKISKTAVENTDYKYENNALIIISANPVTISGTVGAITGPKNEVDRIVVKSENGANITLKGASINIRAGDDVGAAFEIDESTGKTVTITLEGANTLKSLSSTTKNAGIEKNSDSCNLVIDGSGELTVQGANGGAGIGGANGKSSSKITITGSAVVKPASNNGTGGGAGIGGGAGGNGSDITISGNASVEKTNSYYAKGGAFIGGGSGGDGSYITIKDNANVDARSTDGAGIGGGVGGNGSDITIEGGTVTAKSDNGGAGIGGGGGSYTGAVGGYGKDITITGGIVKAISSSYGAGIGGGGQSSGTGGAGTGIKISGTADVKASGGMGGGAGIGGGAGGNGGGTGDNNGITISGGKVIAICGTIYDNGNMTFGNNGAGIGGGKNGVGTDIKISGTADVTAIGGSQGAGIGGGNNGAGTNITISGGTVKAAIGNTSGSAGAGIGGGNNGNAENIIITGGTVTAYVPNAAPAIGSGGGTSSVNGIYISGTADVIAAAAGAAGIGCGTTNASVAENIEIFGSAKVRAFSQNHAGIGGSNLAQRVENIKIYEDANVTAIGGYGGAGIGGTSGSGQVVNNISIYGNANVTAISKQGAGIGGGAWNTNATTSEISISGNATVIATGNNGGAGIGSGTDDTATGITISENATVVASSLYNSTLYDESIFDTTITIPGVTISQFENGIIGNWLNNSFSPNGSSVGIGSNKNNECVIKIVGGTVTAYGDTKPGIGGENADVTIAGTSSTSCPIVYTNEIKSTTDPADYPTEYWGIVFEDTHTNFDKGIVYGDGKEVDLSERTKAYVLGAGKVLTVLDDVTFIPGNKFTLDASTLYLEESATLDKWYEIENNDGEIQHVHSSQYEWYDVKDYPFINTTNYTKLYKSGDKEGIVLCDICGKPERHVLETGDGWEYDEDSHWHEGDCEPGTDCSVGGQAIAECTYKKVFGGIFDQGEHIFGDPEKRDGRLYFACTECDYEKSMEIPVITLIKIDGTTTDPLIGAEFGLYTNAACTGTPSATATTALKNGKAVVTFEGMPNMTYYIKETKAPDGYKLSDKIFKVTIDADGKVTYGDEGAEELPVCENIANANETEDPDDNNESEPTPDDNESKPAPDDNNESTPAPDDNNESRPAPDNSGNPNTGIGIGIAGLALLGSSLFVATVTKGRKK